MEQKEFKTKGQSVRNNRKRQKNFIANTALLALGAAMSISGLIIQCHYHLQKNPKESIVFALNRVEWNAVHVWASVFFLFATLYHAWVHRKWYENVLGRNLLAKHRPTLILTVLTLLVVVSGLIPLFILYLGGSSILRFSIIEIHDKVAIIFFIVAIRHTTKRFKWYINIIRSKFQ